MLGGLEVYLGKAFNDRTVGGLRRRSSSSLTGTRRGGRGWSMDSGHERGRLEGILVVEEEMEGRGGSSYDHGCV